jgi:hypothetical protein
VAEAEEAFDGGRGARGTAGMEEYAHEDHSCRRRSMARAV